jgi:hypothetical protein
MKPINSIIIALLIINISYYCNPMHSTEDSFKNEIGWELVCYRQRIAIVKQFKTKKQALAEFARCDSDRNLFLINLKTRKEKAYEKKIN